MGGWERVRKAGGGPPPGEALQRQLCGFRERPPFCPTPSWGLQNEGGGGRGRTVGGMVGSSLKQATAGAGEKRAGQYLHSPGPPRFLPPTQRRPFHPSVHPSIHPCTHSRIHSLTLSIIHALIHTLTHSFTQIPCGQQGTQVNPVSLHRELPAGQPTTHTESTRTG